MSSINEEKGGISKDVSFPDDLPPHEPQKIRLPKLKFTLLILFGFLILFKPEGPFLVYFFVEEKDLTKDQVYQEIFPIWSYSYSACLLFLGILSEFVGYKFTILVGIAGSLVTLFILVFSNNFLLLQLQQVTVGIGSGAFIIFGSFVYCAVPEIHFQKVTSFVKAAKLTGTVTSSLLGQLLVKQGVSLYVLFYISIAAMSTAGVIMLLFPRVRKKKTPIVGEKTSHWNRILLMARDVIATYKSVGVVQWAFWGGLNLAVHHLVLTYWQSLFFEFSEEDSQQYNGMVNGTAYFLAAACALIPAKLERYMEFLTPFFFIAMPLANGAMLVGMAFNVNSMTNYSLFVLYHCSFEFMAPIVAVQVAKKMSSARFGLIFSINATAAVLFQTVIQFTVSPNALDLDIRQQFIFFGGCLTLLGIIYAIMLCVMAVARRFRPPLYQQVNA